MPYIDSIQMPENAREREFWYNALDAAVTHEIYQVLSRDNKNVGIYNFMINQQGQAISAMEKGFLVDEVWRKQVLRGLEAEAQKLQHVLDKLAIGLVNHGLNPNSPAQLKAFFYEELKLPTQYKITKGERSVSTDREALEKLIEFRIGKPFCLVILELRDVVKKIGVLRQGVGSDSRMRCSVHIGGTNSGRWSSSKSVWGDGTNLQNITEEMRRPFQADPGFILVYVDGEQAESRGCGFIHGVNHSLWAYLDACEGGDLHTTVTKLVWPNMAWTGDNKLDRAIADQTFYRWFTYRDLAKRGGHGSNYGGKPPTLAKALKVDLRLVEDFQKKYLTAFPGFKSWWADIAFKLQTTGSITTFLGRERTFFGRPDADSTLREAIAFEPQSIVADIVNEGGLRLWRQLPWWQPLVQVHDAWLGQIPHDSLPERISKILSIFQITVPSATGRSLTIPAEAMLGFNWAKYNDDPAKGPLNLDGLKKWKGRDERERTEWANQNLLDRVIC